MYDGMLTLPTKSNINIIITYRVGIFTFITISISPSPRPYIKTIKLETHCLK